MHMTDHQYFIHSMRQSEAPHHARAPIERPPRWPSLNSRPSKSQPSPLNFQRAASKIRGRIYAYIRAYRYYGIRYTTYRIHIRVAVPQKVEFGRIRYTRMSYLRYITVYARISGYSYTGTLKSYILTVFLGMPGRRLLTTPPSLHGPCLTPHVPFDSIPSRIPRTGTPLGDCSGGGGRGVSCRSPHPAHGFPLGPRWPARGQSTH